MRSVPDTIAESLEGMNRLHQKVVERGARIIHLTPPVYDDRGRSPEYSETLDRYSEGLIAPYSRRRRRRSALMDEFGERIHA